MNPLREEVIAASEELFALGEEGRSWWILFNAEFASPDETPLEYALMMESPHHDVREVREWLATKSIGERIALWKHPRIRRWNEEPQPL